MSRLLNKEEIVEILALKREDLTSTKLKKLLGRTLKNPTPRFLITDYFIIPQNSCSNNLEGYTTVGSYIFNRVVTDTHFKDITGYINEPITTKYLNKIYDTISKAFIEDKIQAEDFFYLIDTLEWLGGGDIAELINFSFTNRLFVVPKEVRKLREELYNKYDKELSAGNVTIGSKVENEVVDAAKKIMQNYPEFELFESGAKLDFGGSHKTMMLMKGLSKNNQTGEWQFLRSNYDDGVSKDEYGAFADSAVGGIYARAAEVAMGGYGVKKSIATMQNIEVAEHGSDCKTKEYLPYILDPDFKNEVLYMYMIDDTGKLQLITEEVFNKYKGREIKLRSPMFCKYPDTERICSKCIGEYPYMMNLQAIGLASTVLSSSLMQLRINYSSATLAIA